MNKMKEYAAMRKARLKERIAQMEYPPSLLILQVGEVETSIRYIRNKIKDCEEVGITAVHYKANESVTTEELIDFINERQEYFTGIIVQQPLPAHIDQSRIDAAIDPLRDVDGFHPMSHFNPATAQGIIDYLEWRDFDFEGMNAVVIGRSDIVGKPVAKLLLERDCNVTICHSKTPHKNLMNYVYDADLIICAVGREKFLDCTFLRNTPVIDVGINFDENGKICGDCFGKTEGSTNVSPVPGGVGLLTRVALLENVVKAYEYR